MFDELMARSPNLSPATDDTIQQYITLQNHQNAIKQRLSLTIPSSSPLSPYSSSSPETFNNYSFAVSPTLGPYSVSANDSPLSPLSSQSSEVMPIPTQPGYEHQRRRMSRQSSDTQHLYEINNQIKATLTELLNSENVRNDNKARMWIQARLMEAEHELKQERRRKSSGADAGVASSIADHFDHAKLSL